MAEQAYFLWADIEWELVLLLWGRVDSVPQGSSSCGGIEGTVPLGLCCCTQICSDRIDRWGRSRHWDGKPVLRGKIFLDPLCCWSGCGSCRNGDVCEVDVLHPCPVNGGQDFSGVSYGHTRDITQVGVGCYCGAEGAVQVPPICWSKFSDLALVCPTTEWYGVYAVPLTVLRASLPADIVPWQPYEEGVTIWWDLLQNFLLGVMGSSGSVLSPCVHNLNQCHVNVGGIVQELPKGFHAEPSICVAIYVARHGRGDGWVVEEIDGLLCLKGRSTGHSV